MAVSRLKVAPGLRRAEWAARLFVLGLVLGLPLAVVLARWAGRAPGNMVEIHARLPENGGWTPADLTVAAGQPLHLRLVSDDMLHGFAIGQSDAPPLDLLPGKVVETTLVFDKPGKYVFYCTRWCGLGHWRMRGTIDVTAPAGAGAATAIAPSMAGSQPLYAELGLDLDAPHPASVVPEDTPSAARGAELGVALPERYFDADAYRAQSPAETWQALRAEVATQPLSDQQVWDLVAHVWQRNTTPAALAEGQALYAANCAACHGESGAGDGVMAEALSQNEHSAEMAFGSHTVAPTDFTQAEQMLGASPALLQGKLLRGGMGTGMPYWGPILTPEQSWAVVSYLYSFVFDP